MKKLFTLAIACALLSACGSGSPPNSPAKRKADNPQTEPGKGCPSPPPSHQHSITVNFPRALPPKLGLKLEGDADIRVSECSSRDQRGPLVSMKRATTNQLVINVDHNNYFIGLPGTAGFELIDLQNCGSTSMSFFKPQNPPAIRYTRIEYPNGSACAGKVSGEVVVDVP